MNTHVPVRLPVCHIYLETRIHIYKRTYVCTQTDRRTYASACIHTYVRTDGQTDRCTGASMFIDQLLCELKKI